MPVVGISHKRWDTTASNLGLRDDNEKWQGNTLTGNTLDNFSEKEKLQKILTFISMPYFYDGSKVTLSDTGQSTRPHQLVVGCATAP